MERNLPAGDTRPFNRRTRTTDEGGHPDAISVRAGRKKDRVDGTAPWKNKQAVNPDACQACTAARESESSTWPHRGYEESALAGNNPVTMQTAQPDGA